MSGIYCGSFFECGFGFDLCAICHVLAGCFRLNLSLPLRSVARSILRASIVFLSPRRTS